MTLLYIQEFLKRSGLLEIQFWMYLQTSDNLPCMPVGKNGDGIVTDGIL